MVVLGEEGIDKKHLRLFIAYPLPHELWKYAEAIRLNNTALKDVRWTPLKNLHITIFFLGAIQVSKLTHVKDRIAKEVLSSSPFNLQLEKISVQKGRQYSGMIWMKFLRNEQFSLLANRLQQALAEFLSHPSTIHDPIPHVTLARWKGELNEENVIADSMDDFQLPETGFCELWQSINTVEGVRYDSLARFEMSGKK